MAPPAPVSTHRRGRERRCIAGQVRARLHCRAAGPPPAARPSFPRRGPATSALSTRACSLAGALALFGCTPAWYAADADAEVESLLRDRTAAVLGERESQLMQVEPENKPEKNAAEQVEPEKSDAEQEVQQPQPAPPPEPQPAAKPPEPRQQEPQPQEPPQQEQGAQEAQEAQRERQAQGVEKEEAARADAIDLDTALRMAFLGNRDYLSRREDLYLRGLDMTQADFEFGPQLAASINPFWRRPEGGPDASDINGSMRATQILPTGADLAFTGTLSARDWRNAAAVTLDQPLLRGSGYEVSHERLTQAQRSLVYGIRDFELFRQDFSIGIARGFFDLVAQTRTLSNDEADWQQAVFDREKAEALFQVERVQEEDVFLARRREIEAEDSLIASRARIRRAVDEFKILLGLDTSAPFEVADQTPPFHVVDVDVDSAVRTAKHHRLDQITEREQLEDAERALRIAENGLLPDVNLLLGASVDDPLGQDGDGTWSASAAVNAELPLQRTSERNAYRSTQISLERAQRSYSLAVDQLELDIRDEVRQLKSAEQRIALQQQQIEQQQRAVAITQVKFEQGTLGNRDLLDARQSLVDAQNALIRLQAEHFVGHLQLMRDLGLLFVAEDGTWR